MSIFLIILFAALSSALFNDATIYEYYIAPIIYEWFNKQRSWNADGKIRGTPRTHTYTYTLTCGLNPGLHNEKSVINLRPLFLLVIACNPKELLLSYIFFLLSDCCRNRDISRWTVDDRTESTVKPRRSATIRVTTICGGI
jgi:hypothetical protein